MNTKVNMSFLAHIGELRKHLIRSVIAVLVGATIVGLNKDFVFDNILFAPISNDFITYRVFNHLAHSMGLPDFFELPEKFPLIVRKIFGQFNAYMNVSIIGGLVLVFPYIIWEIWRFISPALSPKERSYSTLFIIITSILFLVGVLFGYYVLTPMAMNFGYFFQISKKVTFLPDLADYISILLQTCLGMGFVFLFPILIFFLTKMGIITPQYLDTYRKHAFIVILVIAAFITPADVITMMVAALPLVILYELSYYVSKIAFKTTKSKDLVIKK